jgi:hypothetical protein
MSFLPRQSEEISNLLMAEVLNSKFTSVRGGFKFMINAILYYV